MRHTGVMPSSTVHTKYLPTNTIRREASHGEQTPRRLSKESKARLTEPSTVSHSEALRGVLDAALEIARRRRDTLAQLRAALEAGDHEQAITLAKELCGLMHVEESHRTDSRFN